MFSSLENALQDPSPSELAPLCAGRLQAPSPDPGVGSWQNEFHIGYFSCSRVRGSGRQPAMSVMLSGQVFPRICYCYSWCMYLCLCMVFEGLTLASVFAGVIAAPRVRERSQCDIHGVRLMAHDADVRVYDISVSTCCGNFRASVALSRWVLCGPSLLDWSGSEYAFLFWMRGGVPSQFCMSSGMRWYTAVGLYTMQGILDKSCAS